MSDRWTEQRQAAIDSLVLNAGISTARAAEVLDQIGYPAVQILPDYAGGFFLTADKPKHPDWGRAFPPRKPVEARMAAAVQPATTIDPLDIWWAIDQWRRSQAIAYALDHLELGARLREIADRDLIPAVRRWQASLTKETR